MKKRLSKDNKKGSRGLALSHVLIIASLIFSGCLTERQVNSKTNKDASKNKALKITISSVEFANHQIIVKGTNLSGVTKFAIKDGDTSNPLQIESQTSNQIIANTMSDVTFAAGKMLDFIFSNASAASTFTVNFSLCDATLAGKGIVCTTPQQNDVLSYDATTGKWKFRSLNGLSYVGTWDEINDPKPSSATPGDYYIVSASDGNVYSDGEIYNVGDWIVYNGTTFDHVANSSSIISVFGRTGAITGSEGDYVLDNMGDVDLTSAPPASGNVLKYNGTKWIPGTISTGTPVGSISDTEISATANISQSKISGLTAALAAKEPVITASTATKYYRGDKTFVTLNTSAVPESVNLYFTNARALGVPLAGFSTSTGAVAASDTILQAMGKLQGQINLKADSASAIDWSTGGVQTIDPSRLSLGAGNASKALVTNGSGFVIAGGATATEVGYLSGVSSSIQTQLNAKQATITKATTQDVSKVRVYGANATNYIEITAPTLAGNKTLTLPDTDGANGNVLTTDGAGTLRWAAGGGGGGGGTPDPGSVTNTEVSATANIAQSKIANLTTDLAGKEPAITAQATTKYFRGDKTFVTLDTSVVPENTNLYFTNARALAVPLTGYASGAGAVVATDTILEAFGKLQGAKLDSASFVDWSAPSIQTIDPSHLNLGVPSASKVVVTNGSGAIVAGGASATEVGYLSGVTSAVQTQLNTKLATVSPTTTQEISKVRVYGPNASNYIEVSAPVLAGNIAFTFPDTVGTNGQVLTTDGTGTLRWSAGGGGGGGGTPDPGSVTNTEVSATANIAQSKIANLTTDLAGKEPTITATTSDKYYRGDKTFVTLDTSVVPENGNKYFTDARVLTAPLTGFVSGADAVITAIDDVLTAFNKTQGQISTRLKKTGDSMSGDLTLNQKLKFKDSGTNYVEIVAPATVNTTYTLTLPADKATVNGQVLTSDTSGNLTWDTPAAAGATGAAGGDLTGTYPNPTINNGLSAAKIAGGNVSSAEFDFLDGVTSSIQTQLNGKQDADATLTSLAAYNTNGILVQTAADTFVGRSVAGTVGRISVSNGNGVLGNPTIDVDSGLLPSPAITGQFLKSTGANTAAWSVLDQAEVITALTSTDISVGTFNFIDAAVIRTLDPVGPTDVVTKQYVDQYGMWSRKSGTADFFNELGKVAIGKNGNVFPFQIERLEVANGNIALDADFVIGTNVADPMTEHSYSPLVNNLEDLIGVGGDLPLNTSGSVLVASNIIGFAQGGVPDYKMSGFMDVANDIFVWGGHVGVGISAPNTKFEVAGDSGDLPIVRISSTQPAGSSWPAGDNTNSALEFWTLDNGLPDGSGKVSAALQLTSYDIDGNTRFDLFNNVKDGDSMPATPTMTWKHDKVGIGTTTPGFTLDVNGSIAAVGALQAHSDLKLKKNITPVHNALEKLNSISGVYYDWRKDEFPHLKFEDRRQMGVIAQSVEKVFPEAVSQNQDGIRSVAYTMLIAPLIEGVKALYNRLLGIEAKQSVQTRQIASLQAENAKLKASDEAKEQKIKKLEERLERIEKALSSKK